MAYFANVGDMNEFIASSQVFTDSILNVVNGLAFSYPLGPATGKARNMNAPPLLVLFQINLIFRIDHRAVGSAAEPSAEELKNLTTDRFLDVPQ